MDDEQETIIGGVSLEDVKAFLGERTEYSPTGRVDSPVLYGHWTAWHDRKEEEGRSTGEPWYGFAGSRTAFGRLLMAAGQRRVRARHGMVYIGLRIKEVNDHV